MLNKETPSPSENSSVYSPNNLGSQTDQHKAATVDVDGFRTAIPTAPVGPDPSKRSNDAFEHDAVSSAVWAEATVISPTSDHQYDTRNNNISKQHQQEQILPPTPVAAVEIDSGDDAGAQAAHGQQPHQHGLGEGHNILDLLIGWSILLVALAVTFGLQMGGSIIYSTAAAIYYGADTLKCVLGSVSYLVFIILVPVVYLLLYVDILLQAIDWSLVEFLAALSAFLCTLFGGLKVGADWRHYTRNRSQWSRCEFQRVQEAKGWKLKRMVLCRATKNTPRP